MRSVNILGLATFASTALAIQGFNYGATKQDGTNKVQSDFQAQFSVAKSLAGTDGGFTSARLYTTIQGGSTSDPISAIPAAIAEGTGLLLGMWASSGQETIDNEISALKAAISTYGSKFTSLVQGISVGSEDLYRLTPTSFANDPNSIGAAPKDLVSYIKQVRDAIKGTGLSDVPVGHVDTWTGWVNGSNTIVAEACDFVGMNTFPYFQTTDPNSIENGKDLFQKAYDDTVGSAAGKPVWVTETGWPVNGKESGDAVASTKNALAYYDAVGCGLFGKTNTWWYTLVDENTDPTQPAFGLVGTSLSSKSLYDLSCKDVASSSSTSSSTKSKSSSATSTKSSDSTSSATSTKGSSSSESTSDSSTSKGSSSSTSDSSSTSNTASTSVKSGSSSASSNNASIVTSTKTASDSTPTSGSSSESGSSGSGASPTTGASGSTTSSPTLASANAAIKTGGQAAGGFVAALLAVMALF